jgi:hypothetical protein
MSGRRNQDISRNYETVSDDHIVDKEVEEIRYRRRIASSVCNPDAYSRLESSKDVRSGLTGVAFPTLGKPNSREPSSL